MFQEVSSRRQEMDVVVDTLMQAVAYLQKYGQPCYSRAGPDIRQLEYLFRIYLLPSNIIQSPAIYNYAFIYIHIYLYYKYVIIGLNRISVIRSIFIGCHSTDIRQTDILFWFMPSRILLYSLVYSLQLLICDNIFFKSLFMFSMQTKQIMKKNVSINNFEISCCFLYEIILFFKYFFMAMI